MTGNWKSREVVAYCKERTVRASAAHKCIVGAELLLMHVESWRAALTGRSLNEDGGNMWPVAQALANTR